MNPVAMKAAVLGSSPDSGSVITTGQLPSEDCSVTIASIKDTAERATS
jgi:hypothetical protein